MTSATSSPADTTRPSEEDRPEIPEELAILPMRNLVLFPGMVAPLSIGRASSVRLLEETLPGTKIVGVVTQREPNDDDPKSEGLYAVGTAAAVLKLIRPSPESVVAVVRGLERVRIRDYVSTEPYLRARAEPLRSHEPEAGNREAEAEFRNLRETVSQLVDLAPDLPDEMKTAAYNLDTPGALADFVGGNLPLETAQRQALLEEPEVLKRLHAAQQHAAVQLEIARIQHKLHTDVTSQFTDLQRRAYLREQLRAIQRELGEGDSGVDEQVAHLRERLAASRPPEPVLTQAERELNRLHHVPAASAEFSVIVSYVESLAELPWNVLSDDNLDLRRAREILDRDHHGLEKVKRRLVEFLAVRKLNPAGHGPILCFVGPPGVGKTSLGQSIADALGRKFTRLSLGGIRDEAEIRGHRRTYVGAMPGRLMQEIRRLGTRNPVIMLDEADKIGADFRGDPASALLEVLDPQQNHAFVDHYLDVPFDLSQVLFIATANLMDPVPPALRDRMEVIEIPGYTEREKLAIAGRYLVPRQLRENGLDAGQCSWEPAALSVVVLEYTHESGVRELERQVGAVCRAIAAEFAQGAPGPFVVTPERVRAALGPPRHLREARLKSSRPGVVTGLAYTPAGGEVLYIESARYPGSGQITLTGQIGNVMRESAQAALSLVRSRAESLGIPPALLRNTDVHIHVPSGAVPKDGPSAGIAMFTALASLFTDNPVRATVAMTGELTLRGVVLPIGGLKEKLLAAQRTGLSQAIIPRSNAKDLAEISKDLGTDLEVTLVDEVDEVLAAALERPVAAPPVEAAFVGAEI
jgi:ATP-dependent Lon protease